jgi:protocatechuate 4,5-dioxygenase beta chain
VPDVVGHPELSLHLLEQLVDEGFDLTVFQELDVDHGFTVPLSVWTPDPGDAWPCPVIPLLVNVIQYPQPTAARCYALGQALGRAIASYDDGVTVGILGTGGMSHQLAGARAGFINPQFDAMWMEAIEKDPARLAALSREELIRQAGSEGIELIMWLIMRGAMNEQVAKVHSHYFVPASNTAAGMALFDNRVLQPT